MHKSPPKAIPDARAETAAMESGVEIGVKTDADIAAKAGVDSASSGVEIVTEIDAQIASALGESVAAKAGEERESGSEIVTESGAESRRRRCGNTRLSAGGKFRLSDLAAWFDAGAVGDARCSEAPILLVLIRLAERVVALQVDAFFDLADADFSPPADAQLASIRGVAGVAVLPDFGAALRLDAAALLARRPLERAGLVGFPLGDEWADSRRQTSRVVVLESAQSPADAPIVVPLGLVAGVVGGADLRVVAGDSGDDAPIHDAAATADSRADVAAGFGDADDAGDAGGDDDGDRRFRWSPRRRLWRR